SLDQGVPEGAIWTSDGDAVVVDGDSVRVIVTDPWGVDLDGDHVMDDAERLLLLDRFTRGSGDLDGDGEATLLDVEILLGVLGES
ncbi:MAG: hypothetical protein KDA28_00175, partial [Phycisphaerales bacterium]|nr:hypothetical protein [Phycisphaerales bacterium]